MRSCWAVITLAASLSLLAGCVSMPGALDKPVSGVSLSQAKNQPGVKEPVRWGGVIAAAENRNNETWLEIVEQPLDARSGRPLMVDQSAGRFMVKVPGFLDPTIYAKGREFTVVGTLDGSYRATIGQDYHYDFPVIAASGHHLWPPRIEQDRYYVEPAFGPYWGPGFYRGGPWGWYDPWPYAPPRYRVDARRRSDQPGPGPAPAATPPGIGAQPAPLPAPAVAPPAREPGPSRLPTRPRSEGRDRRPAEVEP